MSNYTVSTVYPSDRTAGRQVVELLEREGIRRDKNLDYTCAIYDPEGTVVATGSCFKNTLRCVAVKSSHRGGALLNTMVTHLMEVQASRGNVHIFIYTKQSLIRVFRDLGFHEIARVQGELVFMENRRDGFAAYLAQLAERRASGERIAAVVMNANPFSLGHLFLIEAAARENEAVHVFIVSEEASLFPVSVRRSLIIEGTRHLENVLYHDTGSYIVSNSTFPSYFQKDDDSVIRGHAHLDVTLFQRIAECLGINRRYVGYESDSRVTSIYNDTMKELLPGLGVEYIEVPRLALDGRVVSASTIREAIRDGDMELARSLMPASTWEYIAGSESSPVVQAIKASENVIHY